MAKFGVRLEPEDRERVVTFDGGGWATFGRFSYGHFSVHSWPNSPLLRVGNFCSIAVGVELILGGEHRHDAVSQYPYHMVFDRTSDSVDEDLTVRGPIHVGHDVWLSTNSVVLAGVTIGNGAVIAAESVVTRDVEPYAVVAGNPARLLRHRFTPDVIARIEESAWWSWPRERIEANLEWLTSPPPIDLTENPAHSAGDRNGEPR
jgi:acetyltransferase-like isoleucine patch superfamily enzyme